MRNIASPWAKVYEEFRVPKLSHAAFRVLVMILMRHFPSNGAVKDIQQLSIDAQCSHATVYRAINELKAVGILIEAAGRFFVERPILTGETDFLTGETVDSHGRDSLPLYTDKYTDTDRKIEVGTFNKETLPRAPTAQRDSGKDDEGPPRAPDTVTNLQTWAEVKFGFSRAFTTGDRNQWSLLLTHYDNSVDDVQAACEAAYRMRDQLKWGQWQKFTVYTVLHYAKKFDAREPANPVHIERVKEHIARGDYQRAARNVQVYGLRRKDLRGIEDQDVAAVYAFIGNGTGKASV